MDEKIFLSPPALWVWGGVWFGAEAVSIMSKFQNCQNSRFDRAL
jgi:hypothetical protein